MTPPSAPPAKQPRVGVGICLSRGQQVLLGQRLGAHGAGTWAFPGGHLEFGETAEACATRELAEETGLQATGAWLHSGTCNDWMPEVGRHYITLILSAQAAPDAQAQRLEPDKCAGWRWCDWDDLPQPLFGPLASLVARGWRPGQGVAGASLHAPAAPAPDATTAPAAPAAATAAAPAVTPAATPAGTTAAAPGMQPPGPAPVPPQAGWRQGLGVLALLAAAAWGLPQPVSARIALPGPLNHPQPSVAAASNASTTDPAITSAALPAPTPTATPTATPTTTPAPTPSLPPAPAPTPTPPRALARLQAKLPAPVAEALGRAQLPADALAAVVLPAAAAPRLLPALRQRRPAPAWQHQADRPMQPASTMKLLTSIVALDRLGPNLRGHTELWTRAPVLPGASAVEGDTLQGDLVLRGGADPELALPQLWALMGELRWQGIRTLAGDIVLDRSLFRPGRTDTGAPPFDAWPEFPYNNIPDAAQINDSLLGLEIRSAGGRISARAVPPLPGIAIDTSALQPSDRACKDWSDDWVSPPTVHDNGQGLLTIGLRGGFPRDCVQRPHLALLDRDLLAERQLRWVWQGLGGQWAGRLRTTDTPQVPGLRRLPDPLAHLLPPNPSAPAPTTAAAPASAAPDGDGQPPMRLLARRQSRPWGELMRTLNKQSDNLLTRALFLQLGANATAADAAAGSTRDLADQAVRRWLAEQQIDAPGLVLDNGSGLSRSERISPRALAQALQAAHRSRWASEFTMSLPLVGVDGTMRNRLRASPAGGWARMKTGTLKNTTALAGYVPDAQGRWWVVVAMLNHERAAEGRPALDALVDWVARGQATLPVSASP